MQNLSYFSLKNFKYDLINKFSYNKTKNLPKLNKIKLHFNCKNSNIESLASSLLAFKLISNQKGKLTVLKKPNVLLKIKKGNPIGCKTTIKKINTLNFLNKLKKIKILEKVKKFNLISKHLKKSFSIEVNNTFNSFFELKTNFYFFNKLKNLEISFVSKSANKKEMFFILKSYKLF